MLSAGSFDLYFGCYWEAVDTVGGEAEMKEVGLWGMPWKGISCPWSPSLRVLSLPPSLPPSWLS